MQNQINTHPESPDALPQFIIGPGGVVNLVSPGNTSKSTGELVFHE